MQLNRLSILVVCAAVSCATDPTSTETTTSAGPATSTSGSATSTGSDIVDPETTAVDSTGMSPTQGCGNDIIDGDEVCDGIDLDGNSCEMLGFEVGDLGCTGNCGGFDLTGCGFFVCGDGSEDGEEDCDGTVGGATCVTAGFDNGTLFCTASCEYDTSQCGTCGDGVIADEEDCDIKGDLPASCGSLGYMTGSLLCGEDCQFDTSLCSTCGNDLTEGTEDCDGLDVPGLSCDSEGFDSGTLACQASCQYDFSACGTCGNALRDGDELCDEDSFGVDTCVTQGFDSGDLTCNAACDTVTTENCGTCANGVVDGGEVCDGVELGGATCDSLGLGGGELACNAACTAFDPTGCDIPIYWATGVQTDVPQETLVGWTECWSGLYGTTYPNLTADILGSQCTGSMLLEACRPVGDTSYTVLAMANREDVLFEVGNGVNATHEANGVAWYYTNSYSMGFAQGGDPVSRNSCDTEGLNAETRLCWHTGGDQITGGYRCGATLGLNANNGWERKIFQSI